MSPSPDAKLWAAWNGNEIVVWDRNEGAVTRHAPVYQAVEGAITWSPDGQSFVYLQTSKSCVADKSYVTRFDAPDFKPTFATVFGQLDFGAVSWMSTDELLFSNRTWTEKWSYSFRMKRMERVMPPPGQPTQDPGNDGLEVI